MSPRRLLAGLAAAVLLAGCTDPGTTQATPRPEPTVAGEVTVLAASSLTDAFGDIRRIFERKYPQASVRTSFAGSASLVRQVVDGAPTDVLATADTVSMRAVVDEGLAGDPFVFATNRLQVAVPAGNPADVDDVRDLADPSLRVALCDEQVPCGRAARRVFAAAGVRPAPDTLEQDVRAVLAKVEAGEVDAALVYRTDVLAAGTDVEGITVPEAGEAVNDYPVVALTDAPNPTAARAFVDVVRSPEGQAALARAGLGRP